MLGSSWVTMTTVMPRSRLSVMMSWSSSTAVIGSSPADGSSKNRRSGSSIMARAMPARFFMPPEISPGRCSANGPSPTSSSLAWQRSPHGRAADRRPGGQREREVLRKRQRAEERAGLKEHAEGRHAFVQMRLANAVDVDAAGHEAARGRSGIAAGCSCRFPIRPGSPASCRARPGSSRAPSAPVLPSRFADRRR